jgi:hypothetical protein
MVSVLLGFVASPSAAPPANITPDPELSLWFKSLRQPKTGHLCCSISDCEFVNFWIHDGHYEIEIDGWQYIVPDSAVVRGIDNPTAKAVACSDVSEFRLPPPPGVNYDGPQDIREILCFVPPRPIS